MTAPDTNWFDEAGDLLRRSREHWKSFVLLSVLGGVVAAATAILLPSYYRAGAAFQAEASSAPQLSGALAGLATQLGALQAGTQSSPQLFGDLLKTDAVLRRVARAHYPWEGQSLTLDAVYGYDRKVAGWREFQTVRRLRDAMGVDVNIRTGVVSFSVEARTPELSLALAESTLVALNQANIALRQARAAAERTFTSDRADYARVELASAEGSLATFYDRNRIVNSPTLQLEESRLRRAVDMAQQVYVQLRLQAEQAAVQEVRNTPAISVIDPPLLPVKRSWPKRRLAVMVGFTVGLAVAFLRLILLR